MVHQEGSYYIDYSPEDVFEYMNQPRNAAEVSPTLENSREIGKANNGGWIVEAEYEIAGGIADGSIILRPEVFEKNRRIKYTVDDDISGYIEWKFNQQDEGTEFIYEADYSVEIPVPDLFMNTIGKQITKRELEEIIKNIRRGVSEYVDN
jgi:carbon monoxide dehydrogenase subunit G